MMTDIGRAYCTAHGWRPTPCPDCNGNRRHTPLDPAIPADLLAAFEAELTRIRNKDNIGNGDRYTPPTAEYDDQLRAMLLDWPKFWTVDRNEAEWIAEPIIPAKRSVALFATGGTGKSLLALWLAAAIATGRAVFGHANPAVDVLYLDYEMTADDLAERLEGMGYGPDDDLSRLHYALLPSLPALDKAEGGKAVVRLAELCDATLVVVDTFGRAVHGDENDADTVRAWYRWTGLHLKADGRAFIRIDHAGKDLDRGQRGSSAKNDDVDVVWQMTHQDGDTFKLVARKRRMGWVPETVELKRSDDPTMQYALLTGTTWPAGTAECARLLDELQVATSAGYRTAAEVLKGASHATRAAVVRAAQKYRREQFGISHDSRHPVVQVIEDSVQIEHMAESQNPGTHPPAKNDGPTPGRTPPEITDDQARTHPRTHRDAPPQSRGVRVRNSVTDAPPDRPLKPEDEPF
jgi:hypothetical protein